MNKVFKTVWDHASQNWVVTSELAKGKTKSKIKANVIATALGLFSLAPSSQAAIAILNSTDAGVTDGTVTAVNKKDIAIGNNVIAKGHPNAGNGTPSGTVAIGDRAEAKGGAGSVAIGARSKAIDDTDYGQSVAIGSNAKSGTQATAIGSDVQALGVSSIAIGSDDLTAAGFQGYMITVAGERFNTGLPRFQPTVSTGNGAVAIGALSNAGGKLSAAIAGGAVSSGEAATAIGTFSKASEQGATAIGLFSHSTAENGVSIGTRAKAAGQRSTAIGYKSDASMENTLALGSETRANGINATAIGSKSQALSNNAIAIGIESRANSAESTAIGYHAQSSGLNTLAIGREAVATTDNSVALGSNAVTDDPVATANKAYTALQFNNYAGASPISVVSVGSQSNERQITNVAAGQISATSTDAINGSQLHRTNEALDNLARTTKIALGGATTVSPSGEISVTNLANTGANNVQDAIINARTKVTSTDRSVSVSSSEQNGAFTYDLSINTENLANKSLNNIDNDGQDMIKQLAKTVVNVTAGKNVSSVDKTETDTGVSFKVNAIDTSARVTAGNGLLLESEGTEVNGSTTVKNYTIGLDAESRMYLNRVKDQGIGFKGAAGNTITKKLTETLTVTTENQGDIVSTTDSSSGNMVIKIDSRAIDQRITNAQTNINNVQDGLDALKAKTLTFTDNNQGSTAAQSLNDNMSFQVIGQDGLRTQAQGNSIAIGINPQGITGDKVAQNTLNQDHIQTGNVISRTTGLNVTNGENRLVGDETLEISLSTTSLNEQDGKFVPQTGDHFVTAQTVADALNNTKSKVTSEDSSVKVVEKQINGVKVFDLSVPATANFADKDLGNITENGRNVINEIAQNAIEVVGGDNISSVEKKTVRQGVTTFVVNAVDKIASVVAGNGLSVTQGNDHDYTVALSDETEEKLNEIDTLKSNTIQLGGDNNSASNKQSLDKQNGIRFNFTGENGIVTHANGDVITFKIQDKSITGDKISEKTLDQTQIKTGNVISNTAALQVQNGENRLVGTDNLMLTLQTTALNKQGNVFQAGNAAHFVTAGDVANAINQVNNQVTSQDRSVSVSKSTGANGESVFDLSIDTSNLSDKGLSNLTNEGNKVITDLAKQAINVVAGKNVESVVNNDGTFTINTVDRSASVSAENGLSVQKEQETDNNGVLMTNYKIGLSKETRDDIAQAKDDIARLSSNTIVIGDSQGRTTNAQTLNQPIKFNITGSNGITTTANGDTINIGFTATALTKDNTGNYAGNGPVTGESVASAINDVANRTLTFNGQSGSVEKKLGDSLDFQAGDIGTEYKGQNLRVEVVDGKMTVGLKDKATFNEVTANKLNINNGPTLDSNGLDMHNKTISNVADGVNDKDAVNVSQLNKAISASRYNFSVSANDSEKDVIGSGENVKFVDSKNITVEYDPQENAFSHVLKDNININSVSFGKKGTLRAAENRLVYKNEALATTNDGFRTVGNNDKINNHTLNSLVTVKGERTDNKTLYSETESAANNIMVESNGAGSLIVKLANELANLKSVSLGDTSTKTDLNGNGMVVTDQDKQQVKLTIDGLDNGGNVIKNVGAGTSIHNQGEKAGLADLEKSTPTNGVSVSDLRNLGWVVKTDDYSGQVKNADVVHFISENQDLLSVKGRLNNLGEQEIAIAVKEGDVVSDNQFYSPTHGDLVKVGKLYYKQKDINDDTGLPNQGAESFTPNDVINKGEGLVTGNKVASAIQESGFTVGKTDDVDVDYQNQDEKINPNDVLRFADGDNVKVSVGQKGKTTVVRIDAKPQLQNIENISHGESNISLSKQGDVAINTVKIQKDGRVTGVKNGRISADSKDAVNGSQLHQLAQDVKRDNKRLRAGIAGTNAAVSLPQVFTAGKSMVSASAGTYRGQSAVAVGYSRASDNGRVLLKVQGNANTRGDFGGGVGIGFQW